jgi:hypothetical protein
VHQPDQQRPLRQRQPSNVNVKRRPRVNVLGSAVGVRMGQAASALANRRPHQHHRSAPQEDQHRRHQQLAAIGPHRGQLPLQTDSTDATTNSASA